MVEIFLINAVYEQEKSKMGYFLIIDTSFEEAIQQILADSFSGSLYSH